MGKTAFLFPGQGAQYGGMAKEFYDQYEVCRKTFAEASCAAGFSIEKICFEETEKINDTRYTQPALLTASCAILKAVEAEGIQADLTAGLSLGEYSALTAARALEFSDAVKVVCSRGIFMEEAVPGGRGTMAAVISRRRIPIEDICAQTEGIVNVANYNYPGQQVISGEKEAVEEAGRRLLGAGASRIVPLKVSGPFHSPLLKGAGKQLQELLMQVKIEDPAIPFLSNVTGREVQDGKTIRELLGRQVSSSVLWQQTMEEMIRLGVDTFVEIGPGTILSKFVKKTSGSVMVYHVERPEDLQVLKNALAGTQICRMEQEREIVRAS